MSNRGMSKEPLVPWGVSKKDIALEQLYFNKVQASNALRSFTLMKYYIMFTRLWHPIHHSPLRIALPRPLPPPPPSPPRPPSTTNEGDAEENNTAGNQATEESPASNNGS